MNASPAADSLPALLAYEAELILVSVRGERRVPYANFSHGLQENSLGARRIDSGHLSSATIFAIYFSHARKVGAATPRRFPKCASPRWGGLQMAD